MKLLRAAAALLSMFCALVEVTIPATAQTPETFTSYVIALPSAGSLAGTEKIVGYQGGAIKGMTPYQILSEIAGDCSMASPPSIVCTGSNGRTFVASAFTDTTSASNIGSGTLSLARLGLPNAQIYVGNASGNPAAVAMSNDCSISNTGAIICTKTNGVLFAASATTDTTNASNISTGTLNTARLPAPFTSGTTPGNTSKFATYGTTNPALNHVAVGDGNGNLIDGGAAGSGTVTEDKKTAGAGLQTSGGCDNTSTNATNPCQYSVIPGQIPGTATNDNASTGNVGEVVECSSYDQGGFSSGVVFNFCSVTLSAGDWEVSAFATVNGAPWTIQEVGASLSETSAAFPAGSSSNIGWTNMHVGPFTQYYNLALPISPVRFSLAASTTIYLVGVITWNAGGGTISAKLHAIRAR